MTDSESAAAEPISVPLAWGDIDGLTVVAINQFIVQLASPRPVGGYEEVVLAVGYAAPPVLLGTVAEQRAALEKVSAVPVKPLARFTMTHTRAEELYQVLGQVLGVARRAAGRTPVEDGHDGHDD